MDYPAEITPDRWPRPPEGARVRVPGSKSLTNRALIVAALAEGTSTLTGGLDGVFAPVKGDVSSQFLSGLLMALPYAHQQTTVEVDGVLVSQPYVSMTLAVMEAFGVRISNRKFRRFDVLPARYKGRPYAI